MVTIIRQGENKRRDARASDLLLYAAKSLNEHTAYSLVYKINNLKLHDKCKVSDEYKRDGQKLQEGEVIVLSATSRKGIEDYLNCELNLKDLKELGIEPVTLYKVRAEIIRGSPSDIHPLFEKE